MSPYIPSELQEICSNAEKDGARILFAECTKNGTPFAPYRATLVAEHNGKKFLNFGSGFVNKAGHFEWAMMRADEMTDEQFAKLLAERSRT